MATCVGELRISPKSTEVSKKNKYWYNFGTVWRSAVEVLSSYEGLGGRIRSFRRPQQWRRWGLWLGFGVWFELCESLTRALGLEISFCFLSTNKISNKFRCLLSYSFGTLILDQTHNPWPFASVGGCPSLLYNARLNVLFRNLSSTYTACPDLFVLDIDKPSLTQNVVCSFLSDWNKSVLIFHHLENQIWRQAE